MNIINVANELEKAIRESNEFSNLKLQYAIVNADETAKELFDNFRNTQMNLQQRQMQGQAISEEEIMEAQQLVISVQQNEKIASLLNAEQTMSNLIAQINQIVMKPLEELYSEN